jgi:hypothetical protein
MMLFGVESVTLARAWPDCLHLCDVKSVALARAWPDFTSL